MKDVYWDAGHYDLMHAGREFDFDFYKRLADKFKGPILELACGTGRISLMLAEEGHEISGIDLSPEFLLLAESKRIEKKLDNVSFFKKDFRHFDLKRKFRFIFIPFNSFVHVYTHEDARQFFRSVRRHMDMNSRFLISIFNPDLNMLMRDNSIRYPVSSYTIPETGEKVVITENNTYDKATQINLIKWYFNVGGTKEIVRELKMRIYYPMEIDLLLKSSGFKIDEKWGDYNFEGFSSDSPHQILLCRKSR